MNDRRNPSEQQNKPQSSQQNILGNNEIGGNLTVGNINQHQYFLNLAGISKSQEISLTFNELSGEHPPLLFKLLLKIDFKRQFRLVKKATKKVAAKTAKTSAKKKVVAGARKKSASGRRASATA